MKKAGKILLVIFLGGIALMIAGAMSQSMAESGAGGSAILFIIICVGVAYGFRWAVSKEKDSAQKDV